MPLFTKRTARILTYVTFCASVVFILYQRTPLGWQFSTLRSSSVALVVASRTSDNTTWIDHVHPSWTKYVYTTDDPDAALTVPKNKGREAMVYLTFIIDNYVSLPETVIFHHAAQYQWHNDDPDYDAARLLRQLQIPYVLSRGYANLRCVWTIGCPPDSIAPHKYQQPFALQAINADGKTIDYNELYKAVYEELFPSEPVPKHVGAPCCAQFTVTADTILRRPVSEYEYFRKWLLETDLADEVSGRIMEYFWHIIFQRPALDCQDAATCYCRLYGLCDLDCELKGVCLKQWKRPKEMQ